MDGWIELTQDGMFKLFRALEQAFGEGHAYVSENSYNCFIWGGDDQSVPSNALVHTTANGHLLMTHYDCLRWKSKCNHGQGFSQYTL